MTAFLSLLLSMSYQAGSASAVQPSIRSSFSSLQVPGDLTATQPVPGTSFAAGDVTAAAKTAAAPLPGGGFPSLSPLMIVEIIWLTGILALCLYSILTGFRLKLRLACSIKLQEHIYLADHIDTPFILGIIHPCIYLPSNIQNHQMKYAIAHEQIHIRRKDHLIKSLAFAITCLHWFNPLVWIAFTFMNRDMEMSCDEAVLKNMEEGCRQEYAAALLEMTAGRTMLTGIWLAFGKGRTKERIVNIMKYKKPLTFVIVLAMIAMIALTAGLLSNPKSDNTSGSKNLQSQEADNQETNHQKLQNQETENQNGQNQETENQADSLLYSGRYGMEVKESSLNPIGAEILIHNNSDEVIEYGDDFHLCQLHEESNVWLDTPYVIENWAFHQIAYAIEPGQTAEVKIDWEWIYGQLPAGTYLLTKTINIPDQDGTWDSIELGVHFTLK